MEVSWIPYIRKTNLHPMATITKQSGKIVLNDSACSLLRSEENFHFAEFSFGKLNDKIVKIKIHFVDNETSFSIPLHHAEDNKHSKCFVFHSKDLVNKIFDSKQESSTTIKLKVSEHMDDYLIFDV